ncbi:hypothetical protein HNY73_002950 [Argiope bruennichi]|uniref:Uncharacterized protein n=1 Tax=Argiope bruennichi TaxID=94029 RepID=A0A8T0FVB9_ARGBR|nr:hypothetical protein HNY73_002950 [Argiope bruennichi]
MLVAKFVVISLLVIGSSTALSFTSLPQELLPELKRERERFYKRGGARLPSSYTIRIFFHVDVRASAAGGRGVTPMCPEVVTLEGDDKSYLILLSSASLYGDDN